MLSYRHGFHAGGWADVHKHVLFVMLLAHLQRKPTPFCVVDAYAGDALYDLTSAEATKTREFEAGIAKLWTATNAPAPIGEYLAQVRAANRDSTLARYPGTPALARSALRKDDRLILNELHPTAHRVLANWAAADPRIAVHKRDGGEFLGAIVTPKLRRGLVLVDPAYEVKSEYETVAATIGRAVRAWPRGIFAIWYPILAEARHLGLLSSLHGLFPTEEGNAQTCVAELLAPSAASGVERGLRGTGIVIINAPWRFCDAAGEAGGWLAGRLWPSGGARSEVATLQVRLAR